MQCWRRKRGWGRKSDGPRGRRKRGIDWRVAIVVGRVDGGVVTMRESAQSWVDG